MTQSCINRSRTVLQISSAHRVSDGRISRKESASLAAAGYRVTVLALERASGATLPPGISYIEYGRPSSRFQRFIVRLPWLMCYCLVNRYDIYHFHDPELILLGLMLKALGRRVVYDVHEAYPMVVLDREWIPRPLSTILLWVWRRVEAGFVALADVTIVAHDTIKEQFKRGRIVVIHNYPILSDFSLKEELPMNARPRRVVYHGDLVARHGLFSMAEAINKVNRSESAVLRLAGSLNAAEAHQLMKCNRKGMIDYLGWLDGSSLTKELAQARAGLVLLHPTTNYLKIRPSKLYEYMAVGLPVIASDFSHWREVVEMNECGVMVDPQDTNAIARAISRLLAEPEEASKMGASGRRAVEKQYNWDLELPKLLAAYKSLCSAAQTKAFKHSPR